MQKPKYEVAVLEDGKIVKIYPQAQYNKYVIDNYSQNSHAFTEASTDIGTTNIEQANQATIDTLNAMTQSFENTAQQAKIQNEQAIAQINQSINHDVTQTNSMLYNVATLFVVLTLVFVFVKVLMGGKDKNGK